MSLTTLVNVKEYLRISGTKDDVLLTRLIDNCSIFIESWLNRKLEVATYQEKFSGNGIDYHLCKNYPINTITSIIVNNEVIARFENDEKQVYLTDKLFYKGRFNCIINYSAGYSTIPHDIEQACIELVAVKYRQSDSINLSSKAIAGETTSFIVKDIPDFIKVVLQQYKQVAFI